VIGFAQKKVDVFGHDDISVHPQLKTPAHSLQTHREEVIDSRTVEEGLPPITTERNEMRLSGFVEAVETARHGERVRLGGRYVCDVPTLGIGPG